jgi:hypothetical protein
MARRGCPRRGSRGLVDPPKVRGVRHYIGALLRLAVCVSVLLAWHRVRMGVPVEVLLHHPQLIFRAGGALGQG